MASLKGNREQGSASAGGSRFGEIRILSERERLRTVTSIIPAALSLTWKTAVPKNCEKMDWVEKKQQELLEEQIVVDGGRSLLYVREGSEMFISRTVIVVVTCVVGY